jgi:hypothetical protein
MKTYKVTITETLQMQVEIEAASRAEARQIAEERWKDSEYILDADHFKGADFKVEPVQRERGDSR